MRAAMLTLVPVLLALGGCQSMHTFQAQAARQEGVSCNAIHQAFNAYQRDRQSVQALTQLARLIEPKAGDAASNAISSVGYSYEEVRASTSIALAIKGCQPL